MCGSRLEALDWDVLLRIFEVLSTPGPNANIPLFQTLKNLSTTSRMMRALSMPTLFRSCRVRTFTDILPPPEAIGPHVRHILYQGRFVSMNDLYAGGYAKEHEYAFCPRSLLHYASERSDDRFISELDYFPAIQSVTFDRARGGVPWSVIKMCLGDSRITSVVIKDGSWTSVLPPTLTDLSCGSCSLSTFSYHVDPCRELVSHRLRTDLRAARALESSYLRGILLNITATAESLTIPVDTAPLQDMASSTWPRLHALSLVGNYLSRSQCDALPLLLSSMPGLTSLSVRVVQRCGLERPLLLPTASTESTYDLHSLTIAYPNPEDAIFLSLTERLTYLSLCDVPRYYIYQRYCSPSSPRETPMLAASECLVILRRISAPRLTTLKLVYLPDDAEEELLCFISTAFPLLDEIELHRYRTRAKDETPAPYLRIAEILAAIPYLRAVYLNIEFSEPKDPAWLNELAWEHCLEHMTRRGEELVEVFKACHHFEYVALLSHEFEGGFWQSFPHPGYTKFPRPYVEDDAPAVKEISRRRPRQ